MKPSTAWSMLALAMAAASYARGWDISANIFLGVLFIIQGLRKTTGSQQESRATFIVFALSIGILLFAAMVMLGNVELPQPAKFQYRH